MPLPDISTDAQLVVVALFALAFAGLFITAGVNVWRGLRRPVIEDQPEHWADDCPWPLARRADSDATSAGAGSGESLAAEQLFSHEERSNS